MDFRFHGNDIVWKIGSLNDVEWKISPDESSIGIWRMRKRARLECGIKGIS
jgi:hypothetical protein